MDLKKYNVSIIMATYNRAHFILETLLSIQNQTFADWECLIIDDGGTDNTAEVIAPILERDKRFKFLKRTDKYLKGLPGCRNYGIDLANGEFIIFFDDDDIVHPQNLELCVLELFDKEIYYCCYGRNTFVGYFHYKFDFSTKYDFFYMDISYAEKIIKYEFLLNSCSVMWRKECFINNRFVETLMYAEDWELYSRILSTGIKGISIEKVLFYGRKHPNSNTGEFYNRNPIRLNSSKESIRLVLNNLITKKLLTESLLKYLHGLAISFRDKKLSKEIIDKSNLKRPKKIFMRFKYLVFPIWRVYKRIEKNIIKKGYN